MKTHTINPINSPFKTHNTMNSTMKNNSMKTTRGQRNNPLNIRRSATFL